MYRESETTEAVETDLTTFNTWLLSAGHQLFKKHFTGRHLRVFCAMIITLTVASLHRLQFQTRLIFQFVGKVKGVKSHKQPYDILRLHIIFTF